MQTEDLLIDRRRFVIIPEKCIHYETAATKQ